MAGHAGDGHGGGGGNDAGGQTGDKIKIGEKEYTAADVQGLITKASIFGENEEAINQVTSMAQGLGMSIGEFSQQGMAALQVINDLISDKVIDQTGKPIAKDDKTVSGKGNEIDDDLFKLDKENKIDVKGSKNDMSENMLAAIEKVFAPLQTAINSVTDRLDRSDKVTAGILEESFENKIISKYPNLTPEDTRKVFATAKMDKTKSLWDHAKDLSVKKKEDEVRLNKSFCEKHGLNYDQLNENMINEQGAGDGAPPAGEGVKITFRKGVKNGITPGQLAGEFLKKKIG